MIGPRPCVGGIYARVVAIELTEDCAVFTASNMAAEECTVFFLLKGEVVVGKYVMAAAVEFEEYAVAIIAIQRTAFDDGGAGGRVAKVAPQVAPAVVGLEPAQYVTAVVIVGRRGFFAFQASYCRRIY